MSDLLMGLVTHAHTRRPVGDVKGRDATSRLTLSDLHNLSAQAKPAPSFLNPLFRSLKASS